MVGKDTYYDCMKSISKIFKNTRRKVDFTQLSTSESRIAENVSKKVGFTVRNVKDGLMRNVRMPKMRCYIASVTYAKINKSSK
jgi:hypothetical protein